MSRNDLCVCGSGKKQKKCHPDIVPDSRAGKLLALYHQVDTLIKSYYQQHEGHKTPPCHKGCCSCCYNLFPISEIEFNLLTYEIRSWKPQEIAQLRETTFQQWESLSKNHPDVYKNLEQDATLNETIMIKQIFLLDELDDKIPCPLLDTKSCECKVYTHRPLICRLYGTTTYFPEEFKVCDMIPSNIENKKNTPDLTKSGMNLLEATFTIVKNGFCFKKRTYPILYWLKQTFKRTPSSITIKQETRDFRIPFHVADEMDIRTFLQKVNRARHFR